MPVLRVADRARYMTGKLFGIKEWAVDENAEKARNYRSKQQAYIHKLLEDLKDRIASGDETPSILGNIFRQGLLSDEEVLLASYTGSMSPLLIICFIISPNGRSSIVAAGVNLGYSLNWTVGYLANRPDLQQNGFEAIQEVYNGEPPMPHEFDRVNYVKALHTVSSFVPSILSHRLLTPG